MKNQIKFTPYKVNSKGKVVAALSEEMFRKLHNNLMAANFRSVSPDETVNTCKWCDYHCVQLITPSDPDNSEREFYCSYCCFIFQNTKGASDLRGFTCNHYSSNRTDQLFQSFLP